MVSLSRVVGLEIASLGPGCSGLPGQVVALTGFTVFKIPFITSNVSVLGLRRGKHISSIFFCFWVISKDMLKPVGSGQYAKFVGIFGPSLQVGLFVCLFVYFI